MPINLPGGKKGLLGKLNLGETVESKLPVLEVEDINDSALICALFRDYSLLASAFLLEHTHDAFLKTGLYGLGRHYLPDSIAVPL